MSNVKTDFIDLTQLKRGQILARKYLNFAEKSGVRLTSPPSDYMHYAIMAYPDEDHRDWITYDATVRNIMTLAPLRRYRGQSVRIYSVKDGDSEFAYREAKRLFEAKTRFEGFSGWNYIFRMLPHAFAYWLRHGPKPVPWQKIPNIDSQDRINCHVLIRRCYPDLIPADFCASASAFEQAYHDGRLVLEQAGTIK